MLVNVVFSVNVAIITMCLALLIFGEKRAFFCMVLGLCIFQGRKRREWVGHPSPQPLAKVLLSTWLHFNGLRNESAFCLFIQNFPKEYFLKKIKCTLSDPFTLVLSYVSQTCGVASSSGHAFSLAKAMHYNGGIFHRSFVFITIFPMGKCIIRNTYIVSLNCNFSLNFFFIFH